MTSMQPSSSLSPSQRYVNGRVFVCETVRDEYRVGFVQTHPRFPEYILHTCLRKLMGKGRLHPLQPKCTYVYLALHLCGLHWVVSRAYEFTYVCTQDYGLGMCACMVKSWGWMVGPPSERREGSV